MKKTLSVGDVIIAFVHPKLVCEVEITSTDIYGFTGIVLREGETENTLEDPGNDAVVVIPRTIVSKQIINEETVNERNGFFEGTVVAVDFNKRVGSVNIPALLNQPEFKKFAYLHKNNTEFYMHYSPQLHETNVYEGSVIFSSVEDKNYSFTNSVRFKFTGLNKGDTIKFTVVGDEEILD